MIRTTLSIVAAVICIQHCHTLNADEPAKPKVGEWFQMFNGKNLDGWIPKIRYYKVGENPGNTFRVEGGLLKVKYDRRVYPSFRANDATVIRGGGTPIPAGKKGKHPERFGHLFYKDTFSNYKMRVVYRFVGDQCPDGPGWATRNSGIMIHGESPKQMTMDQDFPTSIEVQLLGGNGKDDRTTSNLCTPGTNVVMGGKLKKQHCISSKSKTYHGEQWVTAEIEVRGNKTIKHIIDGEVVLQYAKPQLDPRDAHAKSLAKDGNLMLSSGTISLQSESHPVEFKTVEIMVLADE